MPSTVHLKYLLCSNIIQILMDYPSSTVWNIQVSSIIRCLLSLVCLAIKEERKSTGWPCDYNVFLRPLGFLAKGLVLDAASNLP